MKALKIIVFLCIYFGFATYSLNAQPAVTEKGILSDPWYIKCTGENATGNLNYIFVKNKNMFSMSIHGTLIGEESGTVYLIKDGYGQQLIMNNDGAVWTWKWDVMIHANGKPIMRVKVHAHATANSNGTVTVEFYRDESECLND